MKRRHFLVSASAALAAGLCAQRAEALFREDGVLASAYRTKGGEHGVVLLSQSGEVLHRLALPSRGHDIVQRPRSREAVVFARRPGTFAVAFHMGQKTPPLAFATPADRHFYGHGCFSPDRQLLYATENAFDDAKGIVGIYDATDGYARLGEFQSHGIGPHDIAISGDGKRLIVANGGIETHPESGRAKLNLPSMRSSIAVIDANSGSLLSHHTLPPSLRQLSLRHMATTDDPSVIWIGGQYEGEGSAPALLARLDENGLDTVPLPPSALTALAGHVGSIACDPQGESVILTAPHGQAAVALSTKRLSAELVEISNTWGVHVGSKKFVLSAGNTILDSNNNVRHREPNWQFDNHLRVLRTIE